MSPEASAIWMILAIKGWLLALMFWIFGRTEVELRERSTKGWDSCIEDMKECCQFNKELLKANAQLHEANARLVAVINEQEDDDSEGWKHGR